MYVIDLPTARLVGRSRTARADYYMHDEILESVRSRYVSY